MTFQEKDFNKIFSTNLKKFLELYDMTQLDLAKRLNVSNTSVSNWCMGTKSPRMDKVDAMCKIFHCKRSDLMEDNTLQDNTIFKLPKIMNYYNQLNDIGKHEATKRVEELTYFPQYALDQVNAAHALSGASEEDKQHDEDIMDDDNF